MPLRKTLTETRRIPVYRYDKSGKLAAISSHSRISGALVLELTSDMKTITVLRNPKYIKKDLLSRTRYLIEVSETIEPGEANQNLFSYRLIRVLAAEDLNAERWLSTDTLEMLPVSPEPGFTTEELLWAGKRQGNLGGGAVLAGVTVSAASLTLWGYFAHGSYVFTALAVIISGFFLVRYEWKAPKPPNPERLRKLENYKENLRRQQRSDHISAKTQFENALENFEYWKTLSAADFELAISLRLANEGFDVKTTRYSRDGGIDVEATDKSGNLMIVQAKKYASNVGVAVIREMIGVRESRDDKPKTMIYSLSGFTREAKELAQKQGIDLRDVRSEFFRV